MKYTAWVTGRQASARVKGDIIEALVKRFGPLPLRLFNTSLVEQIQDDLMAKGFKENSTKGMNTGGNNKVMRVLLHMFSKTVVWKW